MVKAVNQNSIYKFHLNLRRNFHFFVVIRINNTGNKLIKTIKNQQVQFFKMPLRILWYLRSFEHCAQSNNNNIRFCRYFKGIHGTQTDKLYLLVQVCACLCLLLFTIGCHVRGSDSAIAIIIFKLTQDLNNYLVMHRFAPLFRSRMYILCYVSLDNTDDKHVFVSKSIHYKGM